MTEYAKEPIGVGMPGWLLLNEFGVMVLRAFGVAPFLVGSALERRDPRDIDVRLLVSDEHFNRLFTVEALNQPQSGWAATCQVWSHYGTHLVGKPMDFQIMNDTHALIYKDKPRIVLGVRPDWLRRD